MQVTVVTNVLYHLDTLYYQICPQQKKSQEDMQGTVVINVLYHLDTLYYKMCPQQKKNE
jgi:hypothetical protein